MGKFLLAFCFALAVLTAVGQTCTHTNLSKSLLFKVQLKRIEQRSFGYDTCLVRIVVSYKQASTLSQTITFSTGELDKSDYTNCNWTRSYSTKKKARNNGTTVLYEDYGDLVVGDFNFDGREDFAAKRASLNGGTQYNYYLQHNNGKFKLDKFLTEEVGYAPNRLNASTKMLQTFGHAGAGWGETTFIFNPQNGTWKKTKHLFLRFLPANYPTAN